MKKILAILAMVGLFAISTQAQLPTFGAQTLSSFTCAGSAATNIGYVIDCRKQNVVFLQVGGKLSGSGTDAITYAFSRSADGVTYTPVVDLLTLTPSGATAVNTWTNLQSFGAGYIKINYMSNAAASATWTNTIGTYAVKISAP